jgi:branched-chain amino acid transport system ATP-binding protein
MAMLQVAGLTKMFGGFTAVSNVSFDVQEGEILGLIGPNGSGKSTTFNCVAGLYVPTHGSVKLEGKEIGGLPANRICHMGVGRTFQIPRPFRNLTVLENVALSAHFGQDAKLSRAECWKKAEEALALVGLPVAAGAVDGLCGDRLGHRLRCRAGFRG